MTLLRIILFFFPIWAGMAHCESSNFAFEVIKDVPIEPLDIGDFRISVNLGTLPCGVKGIARLRLVNRTDKSLDLTDMVVGCRCSSAELSSNEIKPNSLAEMKVTIDTPKSSTKIEQKVSIAFNSKIETSQKFLLVLNYQLSGLMCFSEEMTVQYLPPNERRYLFEIPFVLTRPYVTSDVELAFVPDHVSVKAKLVESESGYTVKVEVDPICVPTEGLALSLYAKATGMPVENSDELIISLAHLQEVEISPGTLQFQRVDDRFVAQCILRRYSTNGNASTDGEMPSVECSVDGKKLTIVAKELGPGIILIKVSAKESVVNELADNLVHKLHWHVVTSSKSVGVESTAVFE